MRVFRISYSPLSARFIVLRAYIFANVAYIHFILNKPCGQCKNNLKISVYNPLILYAVNNKSINVYIYIVSVYIISASTSHHAYIFNHVVVCHVYMV